MTITSDVFSTLGSSVAQRLGMPDLPFVVVAHPVALKSQIFLQDLADDIVADVARALTRGADHE